MVARLPWTEHGMSFLSGLPETKRRRRLLMPIQAFIDDSGEKGQGPIFVLAGLLGRSEDWAEFTDKWQAVLDHDPSLSAFKMREAAGLSERFAGWSPAQRDARVFQLAEVINQTPLTAIFCALDLEGFDAFVTGAPKPMNHPHVFAHHLITTAIVLELLDKGHAEEIELIFDQHVIFEPRVLASYQSLLRAFSSQARGAQALTLLPHQPIFKDDETFLPLQAADLYAWYIRKTLAGEKNQFGWIPKVARESAAV